MFMPLQFKFISVKCFLCIKKYIALGGEVARAVNHMQSDSSARGRICLHSAGRAGAGVAQQPSCTHEPCDGREPRPCTPCPRDAAAPAALWVIAFMVDADFKVCWTCGDLLICQKQKLI